MSHETFPRRSRINVDSGGEPEEHRFCGQKDTESLWTCSTDNDPEGRIGFDQLLLDGTFGLRCCLQVFVGHAEIAVTQVSRGSVS